MTDKEDFSFMTDKISTNDLSKCKASLLEAIALMKEEDYNETKQKIITQLAEKRKTNSISTLCEVLQTLKQDADKKRKCADLLYEVLEWWELLAKEREQMMLTVATIEMRKPLTPTKDRLKEIYGSAAQQFSSNKQVLKKI